MAIATGPKIAEPRTSPKAVLAQAKELGVKIVDFKFIDLPGLWQHFSIPVEEFTEELFTEGIGFDGSSIRGFQKINESDMLLLPDADTPFLDPACTIPTLSVTRFPVKIVDSQKSMWTGRHLDVMPCAMVICLESTAEVRSL